MGGDCARLRHRHRHREHDGAHAGGRSERGTSPGANARHEQSAGAQLVGNRERESWFVVAQPHGDARTGHPRLTQPASHDQLLHVSRDFPGLSIQGRELIVKDGFQGREASVYCCLSPILGENSVYGGFPPL